MDVLELKKDQIYFYMKNAIVNGNFAPGNKLPTEVNLAKKLGVGRITLRASLDRLEKEGLVRRIRSKGTFVSPENVKSAKTPTFMIVSGGTGGPETPQNYIIPEVVRIAESKSFNTLVTTSSALAMFSSRDIKSYVKENNVIGIIAVMGHFLGDEPVLEKLRCAGIPVVLSHCLELDPEITGFAGVAVDVKESWEAAIKYLAECGHKHIGMLGKCGAHMFRDFDEQECLALLDKYGALPVESLLIRTSLDSRQIKNAVRQMLSNTKKPTAILCFSDFYAIHVYEALKEMKLAIPNDVAVMGICGYPDAALLSPPLSTVDYEYSKFAEMAVEMLQDPERWFLEGKGTLRLKSFKLRKRKSTDIKN